jgi:hypothetical protein
MGYLLIENGRQRGVRVELPAGRPLIFGRDSRVDVPLDDILCSRRHFEVRATGGRVLLRDVDSSNGTFLNGRPVEGETEVQPGDAIRAGETQITYLDEGAAGGRGLVGKTLGGYEILERIGRGGMGTVYKARQTSLNRVVALKILSPKVSKDPAFVQRFKAEAQAAGKLNHPNIVQVYDVGSDRDLHFYSMEYIENGTVQDLLDRQGRVDPDLATAIIADAARGLEYAERRGIIHRDIKPDNLMINAEGVVKINDLGLAHDLAEADPNHRPDAIFGTPHFISPEQARGEPVDSRSDIYSLGATLYRLLAGRTPFAGETVKDILAAQVGEEPTPLRELNPDCSPELAAIVARCMRKAPGDRYPSATDLLRDLERLGQANPRRRLVLVGLAALLVALAAAAWLLLRPRTPASSPPPPAPIPAPGPDPDQAAREAALLRESRLAMARADLAAVQLDDVQLLGPPRSATGLEELARRYRAVAEAVADLGDSEVRTEAEERARAVLEEAQAAAAREASAEAARREQATRALRHASEAITRAEAAQGRQQPGFALTILINALLAAETDHPDARARLEAAATAAEARIREREAAVRLEARQRQDAGDFAEAAALLDAAAEEFSFGLGEHERLRPVLELANAFREEAANARSAGERRARELAIADLAIGFAARRRVAEAFQTGFDVEGAEAALEQAASRVATPLWKALLEEDRAAVLAACRVRAALVAALREKGGSIRMPVRTDPSRWLPHNLISADETGLTVKVGTSEPRRVAFAELPVAPLYENVAKAVLPATGEMAKDLGRLFLLAQAWPEARALLAQAPEADPEVPRLRRQAEREAQAAGLVAEIRALEARTATDPIAWLEMIPRLDRLFAAYSDCRAFVLASNGTTAPRADGAP